MPKALKNRMSNFIFWPTFAIDSFSKIGRKIEAYSASISLRGRTSALCPNGTYHASWAFVASDKPTMRSPNISKPVVSRSKQKCDCPAISSTTLRSASAVKMVVYLCDTVDTVSKLFAKRSACTSSATGSATSAVGASAIGAKRSPKSEP